MHKFKTLALAGAIGAGLLAFGASGASATYSGPCTSAYQDATITVDHHGDSDPTNDTFSSAGLGFARLDSFTINQNVLVDPDNGVWFQSASATAAAHNKIVSAVEAYADGVATDNESFSGGEANYGFGYVSGTPLGIDHITLCVAKGNPAS